MIVDEKRKGHGTGLLEGRSSNREIDRIQQLLIGIGMQMNGGPFSSPAPGIALERRVNVLDEVGFCVGVRHIKYPTCLRRSLEERPLRGRRIGLREVAAAAQKSAHRAEET